MTESRTRTRLLDHRRDVDTSRLATLISIQQISRPWPLSSARRPVPEIPTVRSEAERLAQYVSEAVGGCSQVLFLGEVTEGHAALRGSSSF